MENAKLITTNTSGGGINTTTPTTSDDINYFDLLTDDLIFNILCRLPTKDLAKSTLVSKAWHRLIIDRCIPTLSFNHFGLLMCTQGCPSNQLAFLDCRAYLHDSVTPLKFDSSNPCEPTWLYGQELLDCSNGLLLYCYRDKKIISNWLYYVVNPITRYSATIAKPSPSIYHVYAALIYDPSKSKDFKVVQFEGYSCLNIYSSENRVWINRKYQFENCVASATWLKPSIYLNGAIYRLSMSMHLLKFDVEEAVNVNLQSKAIDLPQDARVYPVGCMGLNNEHINYAVSDRYDLLIWVLHYQCNEYEWLLKYSIPCTTLQKNWIPNSYYFDFKPYGFHPYLDVIFLGWIGRPTCSMSICDLSRRRFEGAPLTLMDSDFRSSLDRMFAFPFSQSFVPLKGGTVTTCNFDVLDKFKRWWSQASQVLRPGT